MTLPLRSQSAGSPIQVQASRAQTALSVPGLASAVTVSKSQTTSPGSPGHNTASPAVLQGVTSQNIIKQVTFNLGYTIHYFLIFVILFHIKYYF